MKKKNPLFYVLFVVNEIDRRIHTLAWSSHDTIPISIKKKEEQQSGENLHTIRMEQMFYLRFKLSFSYELGNIIRVHTENKKKIFILYRLL